MDDKPLKRSVTFEFCPVFSNGEIVFTAQIQFGTVGKAVNIQSRYLG